MTVVGSVLIQAFHDWWLVIAAWAALNVLIWAFFHWATSHDGDREDCKGLS